MARPAGAASVEAIADPVHVGAIPPAAPLLMPDQDFRRDPRVLHPPPRRDVVAARVLVFTGALLLTAFATRELYLAVQIGDVTLLQWLMVGLFAPTFGWIALSATVALAGLLPSGWRVRASGGPFDDGRCALVMPVYNEDPAATTAALGAMAHALAERGQADGFEIFILSDTNDPDIWIREVAAVGHLRADLDGLVPVWYRRRPRNTAKKAGNIREFVERWGARYATMLVLDADSLMAAETIVELRRRMAADPALGILQSPPVLVGRESLFARLQQFAGRLYGPVVAAGIAAWQGNDGNYWGHNAIIRVRAFAESCGLPDLPGQRPFGGQIMSHDFVEAALVRRSGWKVRMAVDLKGSWEASPPSLIDVAVRDRRWAQGNIQHLAVIGTRGLTLTSRLHFAMGIAGYLSSPMWLSLILTGLAISAQAALFPPSYFPEGLQLFPTWPRFDQERMTGLFVFTMGILLVPKFIGLVRALIEPAFSRGLGGVLALLAGWVLEIVLTALYAPVMMLIQSRQVWDILLGRDSGWAPQRRDDGTLPFAAVFRRHLAHMAFGLVIGALFALLAPAVLPWLAPILAGLLLSAPLSWSSGSVALGRALARIGLFVIPEERAPPALLLAARAGREVTEAAIAGCGLATLLADPERRAAHFRLAEYHVPAQRGAPEVDQLTMCARLDDARTRTEALSWLTRAERMRLLGDSAAFERLVALPD